MLIFLIKNVVSIQFRGHFFNIIKKLLTNGILNVTQIWPTHSSDMTA